MMSSSRSRRLLLLLVAVLLCLSPLVLCQEPDMLTVADAADTADSAEADDAMLVMQMMPDDLLSAEAEEAEADDFQTAGIEIEAAPVIASSKKEAAPIVTKKAPPLRAVPYTYYRPVTTLQTVTVPTQKVRMQPVVTKKEAPVTSKKGGYGGYVGNGMYATPIGHMPGLGYGLTGGGGWSPLGALSGFGSFGKLGWGGYALGAPWLYGSFAGLAPLAYGGGGHGGY